MYTMLYDADTLKPQLLIEEDIKNGDRHMPTFETVVELLTDEGWK